MLRSCIFKPELIGNRVQRASHKKISFYCSQWLTLTFSWGGKVLKLRGRRRERGRGREERKWQREVRPITIINVYGRPQGIMQIEDEFQSSNSPRVRAYARKHTEERRKGLKVVLLVSLETCANCLLTLTRLHNFDNACFWNILTSWSHRSTHSTNTLLRVPQVLNLGVTWLFHQVGPLQPKKLFAF